MGREFKSFKSPKSLIRFAAPWQRTPSLKCPCASGRAYRECCGVLLGAGHTLASLGEAVTAAERENSDGALPLLRAHLTAYLEVVFRDTLPARDSPILYPQLTQWDIGALRELTDRVALALATQGQPAQTLALIESVRQHCPLPEFADTATFLRAAYLLVYLADEGGARALLESLPDLAESRDPELLSVYLNAQADDAPAVKRRDLARRISELTTKPSEKIHYTLYEGDLLAILDDAAGARRCISGAAELARSQDLSQSALAHQPLLAVAAGEALAQAYLFLDDGPALADAISCFDIASRAAKPQEQARLHTTVARLLLKAGDRSGADSRFQAALAVAPDGPLVRIHYAGALLHWGQGLQAKDVLSLVREPRPSESWDIEYWEARGLCAAATGDEAGRGLAVAELRKLDHGLYFNEQRDRIVEQIVAAQRSGEVSWLKRTLRVLGVYGELKPNFFGIGVNVNAVIGNYLKRTPPSRES